MKFILQSSVLILSILNLKCFTESFFLEECKDRNENSYRVLKLSKGDMANEESMTRRNLESINIELFHSLDKPRTAILDLSINRISFIANETFRNFHTLRILNLQVNSLQSINATTFSGLMMVEELDLSYNMISILDRDAFRMMLNLHTIELSANCMHQLPNYLFFRNVHLANIYLNHNYLAVLTILMPATQFVENLNVTNNRFTNMTSFAQYNNIQSLDLSDNPLSKEEMATGSTDVVKESDSSNESDENDNYLNIKYSFYHNPSLNIAQSPHGNRGRIDFSPDVNSIDSNRVRRNMENFKYNRTLQYLMDIFRPGLSDEALETLIKTALENNSEDFKVSDMLRIFNLITNFNRNQNVQMFEDEMNKMKETFDVASFGQYLKSLIEKREIPSRKVRSAPRYSPEQLQQIINNVRTNHLEYFTCRSCSLQSVDFLVRYPELKFVDVSRNEIKTVNGEQLKACKNIQYLLVSDNEIKSLNFTSLLRYWPALHSLNLLNNPLSCDLLAQMQHRVSHLDKMFKLEVNKCK